MDSLKVILPYGTCPEHVLALAAPSISCQWHVSWEINSPVVKNKSPRYKMSTYLYTCSKVISNVIFTFIVMIDNMNVRYDITYKTGELLWKKGLNMSVEVVPW